MERLDSPLIESSRVDRALFKRILRRVSGYLTWSILFCLWSTQIRWRHCLRITHLQHDSSYREVRPKFNLASLRSKMQESHHNVPSSQLCPLLARRWSPYSYYPEKKSSNSTYLGLLCLLNHDCLLWTSWKRLWLRYFLRLPSRSRSMITFWAPLPSELGSLCPFRMLIICCRIPTFLFVPMNLLDTAPGWIFQSDISTLLLPLNFSHWKNVSSLGFPGWSFEHDWVKSGLARGCDESDDLSTPEGREEGTKLSFTGTVWPKKNRLKHKNKNSERGIIWPNRCRNQRVRILTFHVHVVSMFWRGFW